MGETAVYITEDITEQRAKNEQGYENDNSN